MARTMCMFTYINSNLTAVDDAKECKRERDRAHWQQQKDAINKRKDAINKRRREAYHQRKKQHVIGTTSYNAS